MICGIQLKKYCTDLHIVNGKITAEDFNSFDKSEEVSDFLLFDLRKAIIDLDLYEFEQAIRRYSNNVENSKRKKIAIVTVDPKNTAYSMVYKDSSDYKDKIEIFYTIKEALRYFGVKGIHEEIYNYIQEDGEYI